MHRNVSSAWDHPRGEGMTGGRTARVPASAAVLGDALVVPKVGVTGLHALLGGQVGTPTPSDTMEAIEASKQHWLLAQPWQQAVPFSPGSPYIFSKIACLQIIMNGPFILSNWVVLVSPP